MLKLNYKSGVPICDQIVNGFVRMKAASSCRACARLRWSWA